MSSNDVALSVRGLGKSYSISHDRAARVTTAAEAIMNRLRDPFQKTSDKETFWAIKDVSFDIHHGEVVGVIGRNGAGKSTLLKVLSRITEPTTGEAILNGRVGSLLEVGTGFHPELTGRENIYLNGAILGMQRREIDRQFDAIVDFAGMEKFLDTPVKRYSSGMYVRLAFAVAAHLETEIMVIDEVLAVGDAEFQKKCLGKMQDVAASGRAVLFVSHNMAVIQSLCNVGILIQSGTVVAHGPIQDAVQAYLAAIGKAATNDLTVRKDRRGSGKARLTRIDVSGSVSGQGTIASGEPAFISFHLDRVLPGLRCQFTLYDQYGLPVSIFDSGTTSLLDDAKASNETPFICHFPEMPLVPGQYRLNVAIFENHDVVDHVEAAAVFDVSEGVLAGRPVSTNTGYGSVHIAHKWSVSPDLRAGY
ncbi:MAG TPA: ABC transporter ATP-binding protein [Capsulimonadaceae bacterium]|jgi:lipopolysaccharide transport system ATP-binding protein